MLNYSSICRFFWLSGFLGERGEGAGLENKKRKKLSQSFGGLFSPINQMLLYAAAMPYSETPLKSPSSEKPRKLSRTAFFVSVSILAWVPVVKWLAAFSYLFWRTVTVADILMLVASDPTRKHFYVSLSHSTCVCGTRTRRREGKDLQNSAEASTKDNPPKERTVAFSHTLWTPLTTLFQLVPDT